MQKIVSLFARNYDGDRLVRDEVVPGAEWVLAGEGVATRKFDGTCCLVRGGRLYKRYEVKSGGKPPADFEPAGGVDEVTGKQQGWVPVGEGPEDRWHREALVNFRVRGYDFLAQSYYDAAPNNGPPDGTYELLGPKVQGNHEGLVAHYLVPHGGVRLFDCPRDFAGLRAYFSEHDVEGVVWHHPDGRMVKIKAKDFGLKRPRLKHQ